MAIQNLQLPLILPSRPDCDRCVSRLQEELQRIKGVDHASVETKSSTITLSYDPNIITLSRIQSEAQQAGATLAARIDHQTLELKDLDCPDCAASIEKAVNQIPGVLWAGANFAAAQLHAEFERGKVSLDQISRAVEMHGVRACPLNGARTATTEHGHAGGLSGWWIERKKLITTSTSAILTAIGAALTLAQMQDLAIAAFAAAVLIGGWSTARAALVSLRSRSMDMNVLMTIAVTGAAGIGDWFEAATVVALYNIGAQLQAYTIERTRRSIKALINLSPKRAFVLQGGGTELPVEDVRVGDIVRVKPGERIPLDGEIVSGSTYVNEAPITGESMPLAKAPGDKLYAGSLNGNGSLEFRATREYRDTTLARIIHRVEEAQAQRAPTQQFIDRFASKYTPIVVALAFAITVIPPMIGAAFAGSHYPIIQSLNHSIVFWFHRALALLIIACPCALVISTPVAFVTAIGAASRNGVLIKGGVFLEQVGRLKALLYDKTGTLTRGKFELQDIVPLDGQSADVILAIAAAIESRSEHPLAAAVLEAARSREIPISQVDDFQSIPGSGAQARVDGRTYFLGSPRFLQESAAPANGWPGRLLSLEDAGKTAIVLALSPMGPSAMLPSYEVIALLALADSQREHIASTITQVSDAGITSQAIISGDNESVTKSIAVAAGIKSAHSKLLPDQKLVLVNQYRREFGPVGMIGDGINDAPALAAADVGIAMGAAASETAIETADIAILGEDLTRLPWLIRLGRRTNAIVRQNVAFSLATKGVLLAAAAFIGLPLWLAVMGDVGVSLLVTLNALRLIGSNRR